MQNGSAFTFAEYFSDTQPREPCATLDRSVMKTYSPVHVEVVGSAGVGADHPFKSSKMITTV